MPLCIAPQGAAVEIKKVGADEKVSKHLRELGITAGARIKVLSSEGGSVIVQVMEGRLCLDKQLASRIMVAPAA